MTILRMIKELFFWRNLKCYTLHYVRYVASQNIWEIYQDLCIKYTETYPTYLTFYWNTYVFIYIIHDAIIFLKVKFSLKGIHTAETHSMLNGNSLKMKSKFFLC